MALFVAEGEVVALQDTQEDIVVAIRDDTPLVKSAPVLLAAAQLPSR